MDDDEILKIYNRGVEEGKKHKTPSPDTVRMNDANKVEIEGVASDLEAFRIGLVKLALGLMSVMVGYGIWVGTIQSTVANQGEDIVELKGNDVELKTETQDTRVVLIEVKTKMLSLESMLTKIDAKLR
jgi:hypothetical protein